MAKVLPHALAAIQPPAQQIKSQPATFVFELRLVSKRWCAVGLAEIFCLNKARGWVYLADFAHCEHRCPTLSQQRFGEQQRVSFVWIPVAVQTTETRCGQRLVYGRVVFDPRKAFRHCRGKLRELFGKFRIEQICVRWTAAVMQQADNWFNT